MVARIPLSPSTSSFQAVFRHGLKGPYFQILHEPVGPARGCVLHIHPFAEELNKSRRMAALQARRFAEAGYAVLMPDLYGCGDSAGDFGDARWETWVADLCRAADELGSRFGGPVVFWGLRAGCLLIQDLVEARSEPPAATIYWQPVVNGELYLTQFLRLRMAAGMMGGGKETTAQLRERLAAGEHLEVAGYELAPALAARLAAARLSPPGGPICWLEVVQGESDAIPPAAARVVDAWREEGVDVRAAAVPGEPFWTTQEIREAPALLEATLRRLGELAG